MPRSSHRNNGDDPCIVEAIATKLFPDLSFETQNGCHRDKQFSLIRIGKGLEVPAIQVPNNYPAILDELVAHL